MALKDEERHSVVLDYLKEINKDTKVFHLRWSEPALLTKKVLTTTPAFWYMKYGWKRKMVEDMFFKAQIEVDVGLEKSFDQVFGGGYKGERWRDTALRGKLDNLWEKMHGKKKEEQRKKSVAKSKATEDTDDSKEQLNFDEFMDALKINNVAISTDLAKNIFSQIDVNKNGFITKAEMDQLLTKLDALNFDDISDLAHNQEMLNLCMTKKVMDCLLSDEGLQFVETEFLAHLQTNIEFNDPEAFQYLNKLGDRDIKWEERLFAMNAINQGINSGKYDGILADDNHLRQLLFGIAAQLLDENQKVQSKAIEVVPNILDECFNKVGNIGVVYEHLPEIIDNLFKILDNPKCKLNHQAVKFGLDELIDNIINTQHPVAALQLAKIFAGKCELENMNNADARNYGLQCLSKIMFSLDSPYLEFEMSEIKAPRVEKEKLPQEGDPYREWLDCATSHQPGPSVRYMNQNAGQHDKHQKRYISGGQNEITLGYGKSAYRAPDDELKKQEEEMKQAKHGDNLQVNKGNGGRRESIMDMTSEEIGKEFVDAVSNGLSAGMMDPNRRNKIHAFKTNNILNQLAPEFSQNLDKESKRRYDQWESGDMKPWAMSNKPKPLPAMKKIDPKLVTMTTTTKMKTNFAPSNLPDI